MPYSLLVTLVDCIPLGAFVLSNDSSLALPGPLPSISLGLDYSHVVLLLPDLVSAAVCAFVSSSSSSSSLSLVSSRFWSSLAIILASAFVPGFGKCSKEI